MAVKETTAVLGQGGFLFSIGQAFRVSNPLGLEWEWVGLKREIMDLLLMKADQESELVEKYKM